MFSKILHVLIFLAGSKVQVPFPLYSLSVQVSILRSSLDRFLWLYPNSTLPSSSSSQITLSANNQKSFSSTFTIVCWYWILFPTKERLLLALLLTCPALGLIQAHTAGCFWWFGKDCQVCFMCFLRDSTEAYSYSHWLHWMRSPWFGESGSAVMATIVLPSHQHYVHYLTFQCFALHFITFHKALSACPLT